MRTATDGRGAGRHGNNEACTVQVNYSRQSDRHEKRRKKEFDSEIGNNFVTIGGKRYQGDAGPRGVVVSASSTFQWRSDGSVTGTNTGWTMCFGETRPCDPTLWPPMCARFRTLYNGCSPRSIFAAAV